MPDELLAGQDTPASSEAQQTAPAQPMAGTDAPGTETAAQQEAPREPRKITLTEEEFNERIANAKATAAAKAERRTLREATERLNRAAQFQQQPAQEQNDGRPSRAQYADEEAYFDALTDWKMERRDRVQKQEKQQEQTRAMLHKTEQIYKEAEKTPGFDRDDFDSLQLTPAIAQAITDSDVASKLIVYMAANPAEVDRITALSPARQAAEIGKLETRLATTTKPPKTPAPIEPVGGSSSPMKSLATMSPDEYYQARLKQRPHWAR